jgi:hypothetical protein
MVPRGFFLTSLRSLAVLAVQLGIVDLFIYGFDARRYSRLESGKTLIARWTLTPDEWHAFVIPNHEWFRIPHGHIE